MKNDLIELILKRHSYRGKYKPTPVPKEDLKLIMEAGLAAPSGCNKQTTSLIAVDDPEV
ncbi:MAG: nitroreductase family protein, partial [Spirochaetales bacterium]|nr:nitroreductase family protein [Spirochaetales bacterium]